MGKLAVVIMSWVFLAGAVRTGLVGPNRQAIEREYSLSKSQFGMGMGAIQLTFAGAVLLASRRLRRYSTTSLLTVGLASQVAGFTLIYFTHALWMLAGGWAMVMLGIMLGFLTNNTSMELWPHHPRRGVILLHSFNAMGKVVGPLVVVLCLWLWADAWRGGFLAFGAMAAVLLIYLVWTARKLPARLAKPAPTAHLEARVLSRPFFWVSILPFALVAGGEAAFVTLMPSYFLQSGRVQDEKAASILLTVHLLGLMGGRFVSAMLGKRVSNSMLIGACLASGVFVVPAVLTDNAAVRVVSLMLMGVLFSTTWPTLYAQVSQLWPANKEMLSFGCGLATVTGCSACIVVSSAIADVNLQLSLFFGPAVLWLFGLIYFTTRIWRPAQPLAENQTSAH